MPMCLKLVKKTIESMCVLILKVSLKAQTLNTVTLLQKGKLTNSYRGAKKKRYLQQ